MSTDQANACFELIGAVLCWRNVVKLHAAKMVAGMDWKSQGFWGAWGCWNVYYYGDVGHPLSMVAGAVLAAGNLTWTTMAGYYMHTKKDMSV